MDASETTNSYRYVEKISELTKKRFQQQKQLLSMEEYLDILLQRPRFLMRNSAEYMLDMIEYYGIENKKNKENKTIKKFKLFENNFSNCNNPAIIGQEECHEKIYKILQQFVQQGYVDRVIFLHGPNGSSKSTTAQALMNGLEEYSQQDEGTIYRFNWIFPTDKLGFEGLTTSTAHQIGFNDKNTVPTSHKTFAHISDEQTLCKIISEFKENPIFLLPQNERQELLKSLNFKAPVHILKGNLAPKNKKIFDALLVAYQGDLKKVFQHVQVERFYYSFRYRTGIACVEPQMNIDASERQLTMERSIQNLPPTLQNIRIFENSGELIDANRGLIEFSDLLKRPLESFKYLLTTTEQMSIALQSGTVELDMIMIASSNEKHLDAFKQTPDWASFKGRFELIRVPYLLNFEKEMMIYFEDIEIIKHNKKIAPHALEMLSKWAVLTRYKKPDPEFFKPILKDTIESITPFDKLFIYSDKLSDYSDKYHLKEISDLIQKEGQISHIYEGRFGASPREIRMLFHFAAQNSKYDSLSAMAIFEEIEKIMEDRSVYEFLQFEPQNDYHNYDSFLSYIKNIYGQAFYKDFLICLDLYDEKQHFKAFNQYLVHVVAFIKGEKIKNEHTGKSEAPQESMMEEIETMLDSSNNKNEFRQNTVNKMAIWSVENPNDKIDIKKTFEKELKKISEKSFEKIEPIVQKIQLAMLTYGSNDYLKLDADTYEQCEKTFTQLETRFGYTKKTAWQSLIFLKHIHYEDKNAI